MSSNMEEFMIVKRNIWKARQPTLQTQPLKIPVDNIFLMDIYLVKSCETPDICMKTLRKAQDLDMDIYRHRDIRYNYMIGGDGEVYEGRGSLGRGVLPSRFSAYLHKSLVIGFIGPMLKENGLPYKMKTAYEDMIRHFIETNILLSDYEEHNLFRF